MTQALLVSNAVLWLVVVLLACVVAALARQIGVLHERVAPAGALMVGKGPAVGEPAPVVRALDLTGTVRDLGGPGAEGRSTLLFFLSPTCPVCKTLLPVLRQVARREGDWLGIVLASDGARDEHEAFVRAERHDPRGQEAVLDERRPEAAEVLQLVARGDGEEQRERRPQRDVDDGIHARG